MRRSKQILVVEDDAGIREELSDLLKADGYEVIAAADGREALERLRWGLRPAVVLLDLRMSVMTGWEFRQEQQRDSAFADIPVIAMTTGRWKAEDLKDFPDHINKPIDVTVLRDVLDRYCDPAKYLERRKTKRGD